ncbi:hypothetical protein JTE90_015811 [Oedothorax gibbosus]|uniref:Uncharacterized protein n=1 Tax=Oedothorax gibbosus TaxID=931172 RepID=A0AAV6TDX6_9ARAC|nr:hypothetical protein JTE90_015811 [Oedothorax gibbosus]
MIRGLGAETISTYSQTLKCGEKSPCLTEGGRDRMRRAQWATLVSRTWPLWDDQRRLSVRCERLMRTPWKRCGLL